VVDDRREGVEGTNDLRENSNTGGKRDSEEGVQERKVEVRE
jgi:hypothetical protein